LEDEDESKDEFVDEIEADEFEAEAEDKEEAEDEEEAEDKEVDEVED